MDLQPKRPPGRTDRKAARYAADIARLRSAGYTYEAIREALADIGLTVSTSALRREVRRLRRRPLLIPAAAQRTQVAQPHAGPSPSPPSSQPQPPASRPTPAQADQLPRAPPAAQPHPPDEATPAAPVIAHSRAAAEAFFASTPSRLLHPHKETP